MTGDPPPSRAKIVKTAVVPAVEIDNADPEAVLLVAQTECDETEQVPDTNDGSLVTDCEDDGLL